MPSRNLTKRMDSFRLYLRGQFIEIIMRMENMLRRKTALIVLLTICTTLLLSTQQILAQTPQPMVAIHNSELTQALENLPGAWWTSWHYFIVPASLKEALKSDGTPFVEISDADIAAGNLLNTDGSPKFPILISLASEAVANNEIAPLRNYVAAGGFLFIGSSAFTRNPDGTTRGDFALGNEMGLHMVSPSNQSWYQNETFSTVVDHRLVNNIPAGTLDWRMPLSAEQIPLGSSPGHSIHWDHAVFQVSADGSTTVIATGDSGPLLATKQYGKGNIIYHGAAQPLMGHGGYDSAMYAYLIYRNAIEWAFETPNLPIIKLSPWQYDYNAAFMVRHDFENDPNLIESIEQSASFEKSVGAKGDYYFCTGTLRQQITGSAQSATIASLQRAVKNNGATIGSHNGGLKNPVNLSLSLSDFDYWHWGPDEVLDITPPGYSSGKAYAQSSVSASFQDIEGWLAGYDNGRAGCGKTGKCPRTFVAPYFNGSREDTYGLLDTLGAVSVADQIISPFPHKTLSTQTAGKYFSHVTLPVSSWYVGSDVVQAINMGHTLQTMEAAVDFYYNLGALVNIYTHTSSYDDPLEGQYVQYGVAKPRIWVTNAVGISDWWKVRSNVVVTPAYSVSGNTAISQVTITGATDAGTAIEVAIPNVNNQVANNLQVFINNAPANAADYRTIGNTIKVRVGSSSSSAKVQYTLSNGNPVPTTASLSPSAANPGGSGFTLAVSGTGFVTGSVVQWNGASRPTTYVSSTQLTAVITAADITSTGTVLVTVSNPAPGGGISNAQTFTVNPSSSGTWTQTNWVGGPGQTIWADVTSYNSATGIDNSVTGQIRLVSTSSVLFSDDFNRPTGTANPLLPWVASMGTWTVTGGMMQGTGGTNQYSYAYINPTTQWTDYTVQGSIQLPAGSFGGGIGGRVNSATGAHYGAWVYPTGSAGGSNVLKLWKFQGWTNLVSGVPMQQVNLPAALGTGWHTLQMAFKGNTILVYYDGVLQINVTDNNYGSQAAYLSGGISADWWTGSLPYTISVENISVTPLPSYNSNGVLQSSAFDGGNGVQWQNVAWDAIAGGSTSVCVMTRTADTSDQLVNAAWSGCYSSSGSALLSANSRWVQYQLQLSTTNTSTSPVFNEIRMSYIPSAAGGPVINSLLPASASAGGSAFTLTVTGSGFVNGSVVQWNGASRTTTYVSATQLTAAISAADIATAGAGLVTVFNPAPSSGTSSSRIFTINNPVPTTTDLSPASASAGGVAFTLTVNGSGFVNGSVVQWNGSSRTTTYVSATQLTAAILAADIATAGTSTVTVYNPVPGGGTSNPQTFTINISNNPVPTTTSLSPASGSAGGTAFTLTVNGSGFVNGSVVQWNGSSRTTTYVSATQLTAAILAADIATAGTTSVTVFNPTPGGGTSNPQTFTINISNNPVPTTTSLSPASGTAGGTAFTLTVNGSGFVNGSVVQWNGSSRTTTYVSATQLTAAILAADIATAGTASVTVFNPTPGGGTSNALTFTLNNPVPTTTGLIPASVSAGGSAFTLTVNGSGFVNGSAVQWNGSSRTTTYVSATQLTAAILATDIATAGTATVTVFTTAPGGGISNAQTFTINVISNPVPTTTSLAPTSGTAGGTAFTLTVNGTGFVSGSVVRWNGLNRTTTYATSTSLTAAILASDVATGGTASVTVFNPTPGGGTSNALTFTIINPVPTSAGLSPASTSAGGSAFTLTVNGSGFVNGSVGAVERVEPHDDVRICNPVDCGNIGS